MIVADRMVDEKDRTLIHFGPAEDAQRLYLRVLGDVVEVVDRTVGQRAGSEPSVDRAAGGSRLVRGHQGDLPGIPCTGHRAAHGRGSPAAQAWVQDLVGGSAPSAGLGRAATSAGFLDPDTAQSKSAAPQRRCGEQGAISRARPTVRVDGDEPAALQPAPRGPRKQKGHCMGVALEFWRSGRGSNPRPPA